MGELDGLADEVWKRFLQKEAVATFGEREVISQGKKVVNLLGSADRLGRLFREAFSEVMEDHLEDPGA